jgi:hypothetical protein
MATPITVTTTSTTGSGIVVLTPDEVVTVTFLVDSGEGEALTDRDVQRFVLKFTEALLSAVPALVDLETVTLVPTDSGAWVLSTSIKPAEDDAGVLLKAAIAELVGSINSGATTIAASVDAEESGGSATMIIRSAESKEGVDAPSAAPRTEADGNWRITVVFCSLQIDTQNFEAAGLVADVTTAVFESAADVQETDLANVDVRVGPDECVGFSPRSRRDLAPQATRAPQRSARAVTTAQGVAFDLFLSNFTDMELWTSVVANIRRPLLKVPLKSLGLTSFVVTATSIESDPVVPIDERSARRSWLERNWITIVIIAAIVFLLCFMCCILLIVERRRDAQRDVDAEKASDPSWLYGDAQSHYYPGGNYARAASPAASAWYTDPKSRPMSQTSRQTSPKSRTASSDTRLTSQNLKRVGSQNVVRRDTVGVKPQLAPPQQRSSVRFNVNPLLKRRTSGITEGELFKAFREIHLDGSGKIDWNEWRACQTNPVVQQLVELTDMTEYQLFARLDRNNSGTIEILELLKLSQETFDVSDSSAKPGPLAEDAGYLFPGQDGELSRLPSQLFAKPSAGSLDLGAEINRWDESSTPKRIGVAAQWTTLNSGAKQAGTDEYLAIEEQLRRASIRPGRG